jgi:hypothetical protein
MNLMFILLVALVGLAIIFALPAVRRFASRKGRSLIALLAFSTVPRDALANDGALTVGIHQQGQVTGLHEGAPITQRFLLVKQGTADFQYATITSIAEMPVAVCTDEPAATTDPVNFQFLNSAGKTTRMVAAAAIAAGSIVVTNGDGRIRAMPAVAGVYWGVGVALTTASNADELVEVDPRSGQVGVSFVT